jgi:hypothetical protein
LSLRSASSINHSPAVPKADTLFALGSSKANIAYAPKWVERHVWQDAEPGITSNPDR